MTTVGERIAAARRLRAEGEPAAAVEAVVETLRAGQWTRRGLWAELVSLMERPADYARIRALWWESPRHCHDLVPLVRIVARAASVAGEHDDARTLLRKAIVLQAGRRRRLRARLGRVKRRLASRAPGRSPAAGTFERRAAQALTDLNRELDALGVRAFLISGTLLGYVRDSAFIAWDKDIDLGFFTAELDPSTLERHFHRSATFQVRRLDFNSDRLRVNHSNGMMIDLFPHYQDGDGRMWHDGTATRWWNTPFDLTTRQFLGVPQWLPDPPERYLDENYGDWRVPQPHFDARLDTPNVEITDQAYFDTLFYFGLLDAIVRGNPRKRKRNADLIRGLGDGDWLDRL